MSTASVWEDSRINVTKANVLRLLREDFLGVSCGPSTSRSGRGWERKQEVASSRGMGVQLGSLFRPPRVRAAVMHVAHIWGQPPRMSSLHLETKEGNFNQGVRTHQAPPEPYAGEGMSCLVLSWVPGGGVSPLFPPPQGSGDQSSIAWVVALLRQSPDLFCWQTPTTLLSWKAPEPASAPWKSLGSLPIPGSLL